MWLLHAHTHTHACTHSTICTKLQDQFSSAQPLSCTPAKLIWSRIAHPLWKTEGSGNEPLELSFDPVVPLRGVYPKELKAGTQAGICTPMFTAAWLTTAKRWKQPECPSLDEWIKKMWYTHTVKSVNLKKEWDSHTPATIWIDLEDITLCEISQSQKNQYCLTSLTWGTYKRQTYRDRKESSGFQGLGGEGNGDHV